MTRWLTGVLAVMQVGCFLGYDSRWGQQKQAQQHYAEAQTPQKLKAHPEGDAAPARGRLRTMRMRLRATATYAAQVVDWQRRFDDQLGIVNGVLEPTLRVHLEVADMKPWAPEGGEESIERLMERLRVDDDGSDVDWVVGLVGAVPRFEESFHELGIGSLPGKHVVVRAINHAAEYEAFERGLGDLSDDDRAKLRRARLSHKASTVLLHELGHTLGAPHEDDPSSIMGPRYSKSVTGFSSATVELMRHGLEHRSGDGAVATAAPAAASSAATPPASSAASAETRAPQSFPPADASAFTESRQLLDRGDASAALRTAERLFEKYPDEEAVQTLRCDIAMKRGLSWLEVRRECASLMQRVPALR